MSASTIVTSHLALVPLRPLDADVMVDVLGDERMHQFTGSRPLTLAELRARYQALAAGRSADGSEWWLNWIVWPSGSTGPAGTVQATVARDGTSADVAWEIGVAWQGRGIGSDAAAAIVDWLLGRGVTEVRALIHPDHAASGRVAERAGLRATADRVDGEVVWRRVP